MASLALDQRQRCRSRRPRLSRPMASTKRSLHRLDETMASITYLRASPYPPAKIFADDSSNAHLARAGESGILRSSALTSFRILRDSSTLFSCQRHAPSSVRSKKEL